MMLMNWLKLAGMTEGSRTPAGATEAPTPSKRPLMFEAPVSEMMPMFLKSEVTCFAVAELAGELPLPFRREKISADVVSRAISPLTVALAITSEHHEASTVDPGNLGLCKDFVGSEWKLDDELSRDDGLGGRSDVVLDPVIKGETV